MNLDQANQAIRTTVERMNTLYGSPVFDEWAVLSLNEVGGRILTYAGPRKEDFQKNFARDFGVLSDELPSPKFGIGDFEFARHGAGTRFDAFLVVGRGLYLICNNTHASMDAITKDAHWLKAQVPFVELSDKFRSDSLALG
jgi:hypothetical protein